MSVSAGQSVRDSDPYYATIIIRFTSCWWTQQDVHCISMRATIVVWAGIKRRSNYECVCVCVSVRRYQSWWEVCLVLPWVTAKEEKMLAEHVVWNPLTAPGGGSRSLCVCVCVWLYTLACIAKLNSNKQVIWLYNRITKRNCNEVGLQ